MSRASSPSKQRRPAQAGSEELAPVRIDASERMNKRGRKPPKFRPGHPDNVRRVAEWRSAGLLSADGSYEGYPSVADWVRAKLAEAPPMKKPKASSYLWWAWFELVGEVRKRIEHFSCHSAEHPVSAATIVRLRSVLAAIERDLDESRPPWC